MSVTMSPLKTTIRLPKSPAKRSGAGGPVLASSLNALDWLYGSDAPQPDRSSPSPSPAPVVDRGDPDVRPPQSYAGLIYQAIVTINKPKCTLGEIYRTIMEGYAYYEKRPSETAWKNSIRHNLTIHKCFVKVARAEGESGKGGYWRVDESLVPDEARLEPRPRGGPGPMLRRHGHGRRAESSRTRVLGSPSTVRRRSQALSLQPEQASSPPPTTPAAMVEVAEETFFRERGVPSVTEGGPMLGCPPENAAALALLDPFELATLNAGDSDDEAAPESDSVNHLGTYTISGPSLSASFSELSFSPSPLTNALFSQTG